AGSRRARWPAGRGAAVLGPTARVGLARAVEGRPERHHGGPSGVTAHHRRWWRAVSLRFADAKLAGWFERYLKTGSGRALAKRQFRGGGSDEPAGTGITRG